MHIRALKTTVVSLLFFMVLAGVVFPLAPVHAQGAPPEEAPPPAKTIEDVLQEEFEEGDEKTCGTFNFSCHLENFFSWGARAILEIIFSVVGLLIALAASLIQLLIEMNDGVLGSPLVTEGFRITLSVANLGFVLAIIIIAFSTILRIERYELKRTLSKLIIAAILINFSLVIAGVILDFTNILASFFINKVDPANFGDFGSQMADSLNIHGLIGTRADVEVSGIAAFAEGLLKIIFSLFVGIIFSTVIVIIFFAIAFLFLIRYIYLTMLLILMPLAWLFWTLPDFTHLWSKWWNQFLKWALFAPAATFFLYLGILTSTGIDTVVSNAQTDNYASSVAVENFTLQRGGIPGLLQTLVKMGIFAGALVVAGSMSSMGAKATLTASKKVGGHMGGWAARKTGAGTRYVGERPAKATARGAAKVLNNRFVRAIPGVKGAVAGLSKAGAREESVAGYQKDYLSSLSDNDFAKVQTTSPAGPVAKAAILAESVKRKKVSGIPSARLEEFAKATKAVNPGMDTKDIPAIKELANVNPEIAATVNDQSTVEVIQRIRADKASDIQGSSLGNAQVAGALNEAQISQILKNGTVEQKQNLSQGLDRAMAGGSSNFGQFRDVLDRLGTYERKIQDAKDLNNTGEINRLQQARAADEAVRTRLQPTLSDEDQMAHRAYKGKRFMNQNIAGV